MNVSFTVAREMKVRYLLICSMLAVFLMLTSASLVHAPVQGWAIASGFGVTTDWHGEEVPLGSTVTATAVWVPSDTGPGETPDTRILTVEFKWRAPAPYDEPPQRDQIWPILGPYYAPNPPPGISIPDELDKWLNDEANNGKEYYYAQDTFVPTEYIGDWGVQAIFKDQIWQHGEWVQFTAKRATSYETIPEVPFGTIAILAGWLGVLGIFALRRKHIPT